MTRRPSAPVTTLSAPRPAWVAGLLVGVTQLWPGISHLAGDAGRPGPPWTGRPALGVGCSALVWAWWASRTGSAEAAAARGATHGA